MRRRAREVFEFSFVFYAALDLIRTFVVVVVVVVEALMIVGVVVEVVIAAVV